MAVGAILAQLDDTGADHPVAYSSRVLNKHKKNYSVTEKDCLAVLHAVKNSAIISTGHTSPWLQITPLYAGFNNSRNLKAD